MKNENNIEYSLNRSTENLDVILIGAGTFAFLGGIMGGVSYMLTRDPLLSIKIAGGVATGGTVFVAETWLLAGVPEKYNSKTKKIGTWPNKKDD